MHLYAQKCEEMGQEKSRHLYITVFIRLICFSTKKYYYLTRKMLLYRLNVKQHM